ncbi:hypothetical protein BDY21DRAFT_410475 [Lineolata rhizophorae]|uniref:DUF218 domain-containing protein n=1 Tax=Lineolata rhizophorae TaxID=578093 RepID=A0A6A6P3G9_9PEZI|nr:hypothetical protein BDY21DRAFT_410475 [Lineolata rhizophorae]
MSTPPPPLPSPHPTHLILVCCHATYLGPSSPSSPSPSPYAESSWLLHPYQRSAGSRPGEHLTFVAHARAGLDLLRHGCGGEGDGLLVLSGGATAARARSEARGYRAVLRWVAGREDGGDGGAAARVVLEERATDSFQNLVFGIVEFRRVAGGYPERITVVSHGFKWERFMNVHAAAIGWPRDAIRFVGINPPFSYAEWQQTVKGELDHGLELWRKDIFGVGPELSKKRKDRGWDEKMLDEVADGLEESVQKLIKCNEVIELGSSATYDLDLPWKRS